LVLEFLRCKLEAGPPVELPGNKLPMLRTVRPSASTSDASNLMVKAESV
jgi:hypothetical protein